MSANVYELGELSEEVCGYCERGHAPHMERAALAQFLVGGASHWTCSDHLAVAVCEVIDAQKAALA